MIDAAPAGWYPDPSGAAGLRWWDGQTWASQVAPDPVAEQCRVVDELVASLRSGQPIVWRTPTALRWSFHLLVLMMVGAASVSLIRDRDASLLEGVLWTVLVTSMLLAMDFVNAWRPMLELYVDEVVVRRTFDTRRARLLDVESVDAESSYGLRLYLADGSHLQAIAVQKPNWAIGRSSSTRADLVAATILAAKRALEA